MVKLAASGSRVVYLGAFKCIIAGYINVLKGELPSRAMPESYIPCSMFTSQFTISQGSRSA